MISLLTDLTIHVRPMNMIGKSSMTDMTPCGMLLYGSVSQKINHETKHQFVFLFFLGGGVVDWGESHAKLVQLTGCTIMVLEE